MARRKAARSDVGTVVLHWLLVVFFSLAAATGLKIASDEAGLRWLTAFNAILPAENLWYWHIIGALGFTASFAAYGVYILSARLGGRIRIDRVRLAALLRPGALRWSSLGVFLLWMAFVAFAVEIASGLMLYLGLADGALLLHRNAVWVCLAFPFLHVITHYAYGGTGQLLRIFRASSLVMPPPPPDVLGLLAQHIRFVDDLKRGNAQSAVLPAQSMDAPKSRSSPLLMASVAGGVVLAIAYGADRSSTYTLFVSALGRLGGVAAPIIDGDTSDSAWTHARPLSVLTDQGANFGGTGQSRIEIRAIHDEKRIYLAVTWEDPTRSLKHLPLFKASDGWHLKRTGPEAAQEEQFNEDQFSVLLVGPTRPLLGAAIHLSDRPVPGYPRSASGRGLHFTAPGTLADVWVWRADHNASGYLDDAHFTEPELPTPGQLAGSEPYAGGFALDPGNRCYADNYEASAAMSAGPVHPLRLPKNGKTNPVSLVDEQGISDDEAVKWWSSEADTEPYSAAADKRFAEGSVIPSVIISCTPSGDYADVRGTARWAGGRWTLEISRLLDTNSRFDVPIVSGTLMWLAAFDHAATRHTRHIRAITMELQ